MLNDYSYLVQLSLRLFDDEAVAIIEMVEEKNFVFRIDLDKHTLIAVMVVVFAATDQTWHCREHRLEEAYSFEANEFGVDRESTL